MNIRMNSKIGRFLNWMMGLIIGAFLLLVAAFCFALSLSELVKAKVVQWILNDRFFIPLFGLGLAFIGLSILIYHILIVRRQVIYIRAGKNSVMVDKNIVYQYLDKYWKEQFPNHQIPFMVIIKRNAIHITANVPSLSSIDENIFKERVEKELSDIFSHLLGYPHEIFFTASFKKPKLKAALPLASFL